MSLKRDIDYHTGPSSRRKVIHVGEVMKEIELLSGIKKRIREGYYDRPDILSEIASELARRLES